MLAVVLYYDVHGCVIAQKHTRMRLRTDCLQQWAPHRPPNRATLRRVCVWGVRAPGQGAQMCVIHISSARCEQNTLHMVVHDMATGGLQPRWSQGEPTHADFTGRAEAGTMQRQACC